MASLVSAPCFSSSVSSDSYPTHRRRSVLSLPVVSCWFGLCSTNSRLEQFVTHWLPNCRQEDFRSRLLCWGEISSTSPPFTNLPIIANMEQQCCRYNLQCPHTVHVEPWSLELGQLYWFLLGSSFLPFSLQAPHSHKSLGRNLFLLHNLRLFPPARANGSFLRRTRFTLRARR